MHNTNLNEDLCHLWIQKNDGYAEYVYSNLMDIVVVFLVS